MKGQFKQADHLKYIYNKLHLYFKRCRENKHFKILDFILIYNIYRIFNPFSLSYLIVRYSKKTQRIHRTILSSTVNSQ